MGGLFGGGNVDGGGMANSASTSTTTTTNTDARATTQTGTAVSNNAASGVVNVTDGGAIAAMGTIAQDSIISTNDEMSKAFGLAASMVQGVTAQATSAQNATLASTQQALKQVSDAYATSKAPDQKLIIAGLAVVGVVAGLAVLH